MSSINNTNCKGNQNSNVALSSGHLLCKKFNVEPIVFIYDGWCEFKSEEIIIYTFKNGEPPIIIKLKDDKI